MDKQTVQRIWTQWGLAPQVDVYAAEHNHLLWRFWSWAPAPNAEATDALAQDWAASKQGLLHINPPWPLIWKTLQKVKRDKAHAVIVLPLCKTMPWWPLLLTMITRPPEVLSGSVFRDRCGTLMPPPKWKTLIAEVNCSPPLSRP